jgi:hypothetical protein
MMTEEKQQKFTSKVRRGLVWVYETANGELERRKAESTTARLEGFTAGDLADLEAALLWISQNKETKESA